MNLLQKRNIQQNYDQMKKTNEIKRKYILMLILLLRFNFILRRYLKVTFPLKCYHTKIFWCSNIDIFEFLYAYQVNINLARTGISLQNNLTSFSC